MYNFVLRVIQAVRHLLHRIFRVRAALPPISPEACWEKVEPPVPTTITKYGETNEGLVVVRATEPAIRGSQNPFNEAELEKAILRINPCLTYNKDLSDADLVYLANVGDIPEGFEAVWKNGDPKDHRPDNLELKPKSPRGLSPRS